MNTRTLGTLAVGIALALAGPGAVRASEPVAAGSADYELQHVDVQTAANALRTIGGAREVEIVSERAVRVTDTPAALDVAAGVIALLDAPPTAELAPLPVPSDGTRVEAFRLTRVTPAEVVKALRSVVGVARVAQVKSPPLVIVRDTPPQVEKTRALIEILENRCP